MLKNILGAAIGAQLVRHDPVKGGLAGAVTASAVPMVLSRLSLPALVAIGLGGYLLKKKHDEKAGAQPVRALPAPGNHLSAAGSPAVYSMPDA